MNRDRFRGTALDEFLTGAVQGGTEVELGRHTLSNYVGGIRLDSTAPAPAAVSLFKLVRLRHIIGSELEVEEVGWSFPEDQFTFSGDAFRVAIPHEFHPLSWQNKNILGVAYFAVQDVPGQFRRGAIADVATDYRYSEIQQVCPPYVPMRTAEYMGDLLVVANVPTQIAKDDLSGEHTWIDINTAARRWACIPEESGIIELP